MGTYKNVKLVVTILFSIFNPTLALQSFSITLYHQGTDYFKLDLYPPHVQPNQLKQWGVH